MTSNINKMALEEISRLGVIARGQVPWKKQEKHENYTRLSEQEYAYMLSRSNKYPFQEGGMKGKPDYGKIAKELNNTFHEGKYVRDRYSVRNALYKFKKQKK